MHACMYVLRMHACNQVSHDFLNLRIPVWDRDLCFGPHALYTSTSPSSSAAAASSSASSASASSSSSSSSSGSSKKKHGSGSGSGAEGQGAGAGSGGVSWRALNAGTATTADGIGPFLVATGTAYHQVRIYDTRAQQRPIFVRTLPACRVLCRALLCFALP